ncbi:hypothetical protein C8J57DRAFT_509491 [Mycena rebaudengoi]|nr:hypothetical protein C8J57DRAFT_509491 [Mycena rebaudengoi]
MPLDGHSYLVAQGWTGKGTGLRQGAISRPLAIPQKKTLAGLGKERDEAFPFWDHLFSAASKSIQIKISNDDDDNSDNTEPTGVSLKRTSTGILSNRRPVTGTIATSSGTATPDTEDTSPRLSLLATAKREAAKRGLYSRFFAGLCWDLTRLSTMNQSRLRYKTLRRFMSRPLRTRRPLKRRSGRFQVKKMMTSWSADDGRKRRRN